MIYILLSTFNGEQYLPFLLSSLLNQTQSNWKLLVRDDGSNDKTLAVLKKFKSNNENVILIKSDGKNLGIKKSFSLLLNEVLKHENGEYIMFCDQDDIWLDDKIEKTMLAMKKLEQKYLKEPLLVHTDLIVTDENLRTLDNSFWHYEHIDPLKNSLNRLLMQNTITGCSMMINEKLASMVKDIPDNSIMHDWWFGLVAAEFGKIDFVQDATIKYRQHQNNDTGAVAFNLINILKKIIALLLSDNSYKKYSIQAKEFLQVYQDILSKEKKEMLENFANIEHKPFWQRKQLAIKHRLLKQGYMKNIGLLIKI